MSEPLTLEALEKRVVALETMQKQQQCIVRPRRSLATAMELYSNMDAERRAFHEQWDAECRAIREADREKARRQFDDASEDAA